MVKTQKQYNDVRSELAEAIQAEVKRLEPEPSRYGVTYKPAPEATTGKLHTMRINLAGLPGLNPSKKDMERAGMCRTFLLRPTLTR